MKKRLTGKPACIAILAVLLIISLADVILRAFVFGEIASTAANYGEVLITAAFALMLVIFALKGKDRLFYILCGAFLAYFVLNQLFGLPAVAADFVAFLSAGPDKLFRAFATFFHLLSIIGIVAIGALIVEYMNDGTIYNKVFNFFCIFTILMFTSTIATSVYDAIVNGGFSIPVFAANILFIILNTLSRITMVFLFVFFAYDTAKRHLTKTKL